MNNLIKLPRKFKLLKNYRHYVGRFMLPITEEYRTAFVKGKAYKIDSIGKSKEEGVYFNCVNDEGIHDGVFAEDENIYYIIVEFASVGKQLYG